MSSIRREVGFLRAVRATGLKNFMLPEGALALLVASVAALLLCTQASVLDRVEVAASSLRIIAPLLGVVLAALTFVVSFASDEYLRHLKATESGVIAFYRPFVFLIGIEILTLILIITYQAMATKTLAGVEVFDLWSDVFPGRILHFQRLSGSAERRDARSLASKVIGRLNQILWTFRSPRNSWSKGDQIVSTHSLAVCRAAY